MCEEGKKSVRNSFVGTEVRKQGGEVFFQVPGARAEIALQPMESTMLEQMSTVEDHMVDQLDVS